MNGNDLEHLFKPLLGAGWQKKLAKLSRLSQNSISHYKNGKRAITPDRELYFEMLHDWYVRQNNITAPFALGHDIMVKVVGGNVTFIRIENELREVSAIGGMSIAANVLPYINLAIRKGQFINDISKFHITYSFSNCFGRNMLAILFASSSPLFFNLLSDSFHRTNKER